MSPKRHTMHTLDHPIALHDLAARLGDLPPLPAVVLELLQATRDTQTNLETLSAKIGHDQVMAARVLGLANSSFYGMAGRISQISEAIAILGIRSVRSVALGARLHAAFPTGGLPGLRGFWRHTMATALFARELAPGFGLDDDLAFTAGLLHDLGRLALACCFPEPWQQTLEHQARSGVPMLQAEREVLGVDHQQAGAVLARCWHFPAEMTEVMSRHHGSELHLAPGLPALVALANGLSRGVAHAAEDGARALPVPPETWVASGLSPTEGEQLCARVERELEILAEALGQ